MKINLFFLLALSALLLDSCSSGKSALKHGDYYNAVLAATQRLRQKSDHKKSKEILKLSYQLAIDYLETDAKNQLESNANFKYRTAVQNYEKINTLYEEIRTSPGALQVIPKPVNRFDKLTEMKAKAAEETYEAGLQAMLKNTRVDAKQAYSLFNEAHTFSPNYREVIEMIEQSKYNATLKVVVQPTLQNYRDWNFEPVLFGYTSNQFVKLYTSQQAEDENLTKIDQYIKVIVNGFEKGWPKITKKSETHSDSVKVGEVTVNEKKIPKYRMVTATMITYTKKISGRGAINLIITDAAGGNELQNNNIVSHETWSGSWATYRGDKRALSTQNQNLCKKKEPFPERNYLVNRVKRELNAKLSYALEDFYRNY